MSGRLSAVTQANVSLVARANLHLDTRGPGLTDITGEARRFIAETNAGDGALLVFLRHTSASLTIQENADPDVMADMETVLDRMVPWNGGYRHAEGNTAAHVKASMMGSSVQVQVSGGRLRLGTWQSLYLCEFDGPRTREVWIKGISAE